MYRELLIGCGNRRDKRMGGQGRHSPDNWQCLTTCDISEACRPDLVIDLEKTPWCAMNAPGNDRAATQVLDLYECLRADTFDEVHAYEVLEHLGHQGDVWSFFGTFKEIWRVLKPGGHLCATVPSRFSEWLWADPGHRRAITPASLVFLVQPQYTHQVGVTPMSDYREHYAADFDIVFCEDDQQTHRFVLQAVKPSRYVEPVTE